MALTTAQIVRSRLNDPVRFEAETLYGDGTASAFKLKQGSPYSTISGGSFTANIAVAAGWSATGTAAFDPTAGYVTFGTAISALSALYCVYSWSVFSEDELSYFTAQGGIPQAALMGVNHLLVNYAKRGSWAAPDGTNYNDTQAINALLAIRSGLVSEIRGAELGPDGTTVDWAAEQENYF